MSSLNQETGTKETVKQRSNTALYIAALIIMLLVTAVFAVVGFYFLPLLFTVLLSAALMGAVGLLIGLEISLIIASLRLDIHESAFFPNQTQRSYAIVILGMGLGIMAALLLGIAFPALVGVFAFAGPGAVAILGALGLIAGLAIVGIVFLAIDLLRISPHAFEKLSLAQPFKGISSLMGLKALEQGKELSKGIEVQKKEKTLKLKETHQPKKYSKPLPPHKRKEAEKKIESHKPEEKKKEKVESVIDSSSAELVIDLFPKDGSGSVSSSPSSSPTTESRDSFGAPTSAHHGQPEHKLNVKAVAADPELVAVIPKTGVIPKSQVGEQYNKFFNQTEQVKGFFQLLTTKLAQLAPDQSPLTGALKDLHEACKLIAGNKYPSDRGLKFLIVNFEALEAKLEAYRKEAGSDAKRLEPLAQSVEQYKVALIIQACLDPRYDAESKDISLREARAKFIKNASPEVIEKVHEGLQVHIEKLKAGDGATTNAREIARLGKIIDEGLRKAGAAALTSV